MNILVTGANGQLGRELRKASACSPHRFIFTDVTEIPGVETVFLDITEISTVRLVCASESVDVIVNCAAFTNVDAAESDTDAAGRLNSHAPAVLAEVAAGRNATLIHVSTDYVFDGTACTPYKESDIPCPASVYGSTKLAGEKAVMESGCNYIILRTAWLYSPYGKNFVKTIGQRCTESTHLRVVVDQVGSPTCAADLASAILHIIDEGKLSCRGVYHFTDEGAISWYDFAKAIVALRGSDCVVIPCLSGEYPSPVRRPHYSVLDKSFFKRTFGMEIPYWMDSLKKCMEEIWKG